MAKRGSAAGIGVAVQISILERSLVELSVTDRKTIGQDQNQVMTYSLRVPRAAPRILTEFPVPFKTFQKVKVL